MNDNDVQITFKGDVIVQDLKGRENHLPLGHLWADPADEVIV